MDIRQLRYFLAIAEAPSISAAAQTIGVAQPSLSQHLHRMEEELSVKLVERSARGTALTNEGHMLVEHARRICDSLDRCVADMRELGGAVRGRVCFGMPPSCSMIMSVPLAETVRLELPEIRLRAVETMSGYLKGWLADGTVDMAFLYDLKDLPHVPSTHVLNEELFFYSAPDAWPLDTPPGAPVPLRALQGLDMILPLQQAAQPDRGVLRPNDVQLNVVGRNGCHDPDQGAGRARVGLHDLRPRRGAGLRQARGAAAGAHRFPHDDPSGAAGPKPRTRLEPRLPGGGGHHPHRGARTGAPRDLGGRARLNGLPPPARRLAADHRPRRRDVPLIHSAEATPAHAVRSCARGARGRLPAKAAPDRPPRELPPGAFGPVRDGGAAPCERPAPHGTGLPPVPSGAPDDAQETSR